MLNRLSENKFILLIKKEPLFFLLLSSLYFGSGISYGKFYLFHLIIPVYLLVYGLRKTAVSGVFKKEFFPLHLIYFVIGIISMLREINLDFLIYYLISYTVFIAFCLNKEYISNNFKTILIFLFGLLSLDVLIGSLEVLTNFRYPISHLSKFNHLFGRNYNAFENFDGCSDLNYALSSPTGFHWNQNNYAFVLMLFLPFTTYLSGKWLRNSLRTILFLLIVATGSRIGIYTSFFAISLLLIFEWKINKFSWILPVFTMALIFSDGFYYLPLHSKKIKEVAFVSQSKFSHKFPHHCNSKVKSKESRMNLTKKGLELFKLHPIIGGGAGSFNKNLQKENDAKIKRSEPIGTSSPHNFILELLVDFGAILFVPIFYLIFLLFRSLRLESNPSKVVIFLFFILLLPGTIMLSSLVYFLPFYLFLFLILVYLLNSKSKNSYLKVNLAEI